MWLVLLQISYASDKTNLKNLSRFSPKKISYQHFVRFLKASSWFSQSLIEHFVNILISKLPPPEDATLYVTADATFKPKKGRKSEAHKKGKTNLYKAYVFGFQLILISFHWDSYRIPVMFRVIRKKRDPLYKKENELFREMLDLIKIPTWAKRVIVLADSAYCSGENLKFIKKKKWFFVMGMARTWKMLNNKSLKNLIKHLPKQFYQKTWVPSLRGERRRYYWCYKKKGALRHVGDVTIILSKLSRNVGHKRTKILVTNLPNDVGARTILACYQKRWITEILFKELKDGLGMGQYQTQGDVGHTTRGCAIAIIAHLVLQILQHKDIPKKGSWGISQLRFSFLQRALIYQHEKNQEKLWKKAA